MDIEEMNRMIIEGIRNSLSDGAEEALSFAAMNYTNSNNDYFKESRGYAEEVIFATYEYQCFHENTGEAVDFKRYVTDIPYRLETHQKKCASLDAALADKLLRSGSNQYQAGEIENAVGDYRKAAHLGNAAAMYEYGLFLCDGEGCEKNELYGSFWYWEAAQMGELRAMYNLGVNYREGVGVKKDMVQMLYWYARSAEQLCEEAVYSLGASLAGGEVLSGENIALVGHTFMRAAAQINGSRRAQKFVKKNVKIILDILAEDVGLYNLPPNERRGNRR